MIVFNLACVVTSTIPITNIYQMSGIESNVPLATPIDGSMYSGSHARLVPVLSVPVPDGHEHHLITT